MKTPEQNRVTNGHFASDESYGPNGLFILKKSNLRLLCISSDQGGWDHVSISLQTLGGKLVKRTPNWDEMCFVKDHFWEDEETVIQYHPPKSKYVNNHSFVLHLWKKQGEEYELPPQEFV